MGKGTAEEAALQEMLGLNARGEEGKSLAQGIALLEQARTRGLPRRYLPPPPITAFPPCS